MERRSARFAADKMKNLSIEDSEEAEKEYNILKQKLETLQSQTYKQFVGQWINSSRHQNMRKRPKG